MGVFRSDGGWAAQERVLTPPFIVSMSPPGYPSAWLRPRSARLRFARQDHCSAPTTAVSQHPVGPVIAPKPRPGQTPKREFNRLFSVVTLARRSGGISRLLLVHV